MSWLKSEPVVVALGALSAVLVALEQVPLPGPWGLVAKLGAVVLAAATARAQVTPTASAE